MIKYYTRACNFYYGIQAKKLIQKKQALSLCGSNNLAFDKIEVLPNLFINGKFTLGENIGDLGGVNSAFDGLQLFLNQAGNIDDIDGFSQNQRFFISWATIWRTKMREEALRTRVMTDPHSPGMYRGYVPLQNVESFYEAFDVQEGDQMYLSPEERIKIW